MNSTQREQVRHLLALRAPECRNCSQSASRLWLRV